jgi:hypothetical protein
MKFWRVVLVATLVSASPLCAGTLSVTFSSVPEGSVVDLTSEGKTDWVHWGLHTDSSLHRKAGVTPLIADFERQDASNGFSYVYQYADNYNGYSWSDGVPETAVTNTPTGVWAYGTPTVGSGFLFTAPADTTLRRLQVYVGVFAGVGLIEVSLSDNSAPAYTNASLTNQRNGPGGVYAIDYAADSPGQTVTVRWTLLSPRGQTPNVTLQAAALTAPTANNPPFVVLTNAPNSQYAAGTPIELGAEGFDRDGQVSRVEFFDRETKLGEDNAAPFTFNWIGAIAGHHIVTARAVDDQGASRPAHPVDLFVHGSGGAITGAMSFPTSSVDLTSEGTLDWAHFGRTDANSVNRKTNTVPHINMTLLDAPPPGRLTDYPTSFAWTDGTPLTSETGTRTCTYVPGFTNGFRITVPADTVSRTLRVYVGLYGAAGTLQAFLSDGSAAAYTDTTLDDIFADRYGVYTIGYHAASPGQVLTVQYRATRLYDMDFGSLTLAAISLQGTTVRPPLRILNPHEESGSLVFEFSAEMGQNYTVEYADTLPSSNWQTLTTITGDGTTRTVSDPASLPSRFYRVRTP